MSDKKLNMRAYYHTFESTGEMGADRILSAVASAGKSAHNTADWDEEWKNIQSAAVETAGEIAELKQRLAAAEAKIPKWIPVSERMPKDKKPIYMIALVPERNYTTDQYAGWYTLGKWTRWPHRLPPTHWSYQIDNPEGDL